METKEIDLDAGDETKELTTINVRNTGKKYFYIQLEGTATLILINSKFDETEITVHNPKNKIVKIRTGQKNEVRVNPF